MSSQNVKTFFSKSRRYLIVGASSNPTKFGFRVVNWYARHNLPYIPINPNSRVINGIRTAENIHEAWNLINKEEKTQFDGISVSFITPPDVTKSVLQSFKNSNSEELLKNVKGVWFQPGSYDSKVLQLTKELGINSVLAYGDCILVQGGALLDNALKE